MERSELFARLLEGTSNRWHWWSFHFQSAARGDDVPFVPALLGALLVIDDAMPGYAARNAEAIVALAGRDHHEPHYEQLLQRLAEIHVALHVVHASWPPSTSLADEPVAPGSARNPELVVSTPQARLGVEVKAPALLEHQRRRSVRRLQAGGRLFEPEQLIEMAGDKDELILSRDNPVKDFLISAEAKFLSFRQVDPDFYGLLVIVWDDFIQEPITSLIHPASGLLTANSFARDEQGSPLTFPSIDGILLVPHLQYFKLALAEEGRERPFEIGRDIFKWDIDPGRPAAYLATPDGRPIPEDIGSSLNLRPLTELAGAEYQPSDLVLWMNQPTES